MANSAFCGSQAFNSDCVRRNGCRRDGLRRPLENGRLRRLKSKGRALRARRVGRQKRGRACAERVNPFLSVDFVQCIERSEMPWARRAFENLLQFWQNGKRPFMRNFSKTSQNRKLKMRSTIPRHYAEYPKKLNFSFSKKTVVNNIQILINRYTHIHARAGEKVYYI